MKHWMYGTACAGLMTFGISMAQAQDVNCNQNFTAVDSNGDGIVSTAEATSASSSEFDRLDTDKSGSISQSEWSSCSDMAMSKSANDNAAASTSGSDGSQPMSTDDQFSEADADQSGDVSRDEAATAAQSAYTGSTTGNQDQATTGDNEQAARNFGARFAMIDSDGDGTVSREEWNNRDNVTIDTAFKRLDSDGNGEVSKSEYQEARNVDSGSGRQPVTIWYYYIY